jgi:phosphate transport system substrate-binding protein
VGGAGHRIVVVVPGKNTAAHKNFRRISMKGTEIRYDYMAEQSHDVLQAVRSMPYSISFITHGATVKKPGLSLVNINGISVKDKRYPFYQTMYLITRGEPRGAVEKFITFFQTGKGVDIIKEKGMVPMR